MSQKQVYKEEPYRFVVASVYILGSVVGSLPVHTFASMNTLVERVFDITPVTIIFNTLIFTVCHVVLCFPANWFINKYGMRPTLIFGALAISGGSWLRLTLSTRSMEWCLVGSLMAALGNIFFYNNPSKMAGNWFRQGTAGIVAFIAINASILSLALGASIPGYFTDKYSTQQDIKRFLFAEACVISIPMLLVIIFFREKPETPPSKAAAKQLVKSDQPTKYRQVLVSLFSNRQYWKLMGVLSCNYGCLTAIIATLDQQLTGFAYPDSGQITSVILISSLAAGLVSNIVFSYLIKITKAYKKFVMLGTFGSFATYCMVMASFMTQIQDEGVFYLIGAVSGFFNTPVTSMVIMLACETVFPIEQSSAAGYLFAAAQTTGFILGLVGIQVLNKTKTNSQIVGFLFAGIHLISFLLASWVIQDLKKWKYEQSNQLLVKPYQVESQQSSQQQQ